MYAEGRANGRGVAPDPRRLDAENFARLDWLTAALADAERHARLFRSRREETEALLMPRPVPVERAYATLGLALGTLPPAAIFFRLLLVMPDSGACALLFAAIHVAMLAVCALVGRWMGKRVGRIIGQRPHPTRLRAILESLLWGLVWASATGALGGLPFFGAGAVFGIICAIMVALPSFVTFTLLHRLLARGGMIDARHLRPLAWGVAGTIAALILSPRLLPY